jgi:hypothetical protein
MNIQSDIAVYDNAGNLVLVVEVKNRRGTDSEWAAAMRRNLFIHGYLPNTPYFLLAMPDRFYLWKDVHSADTVKPDYEIDPSSIFELYLGKTDLGTVNLSGAGLELLVSSWLNELTRETNQPSDEAVWLIESGLLDALRRGQVIAETTP